MRSHATVAGRRKGLQKITAGTADPFEIEGFCRETTLTQR